MRLTNLGYLMKEGIRGIFLHGFMSFAAVLVTVACLLIVGSFTILVVTHEKDLVERFGKRVIVLNEGLVVSDGMDGYYRYEDQ